MALTLRDVVPPVPGSLIAPECHVPTYRKAKHRPKTLAHFTIPVPHASRNPHALLPERGMEHTVDPWAVIDLISDGSQNSYGFAFLLAELDRLAYNLGEKLTGYLSAQAGRRLRRRYGSNGWVTAGLRSLASVCGRSISTVARDLKWGVEHGYIDCAKWDIAALEMGHVSTWKITRKGKDALRTVRRLFPLTIAHFADDAETWQGLGLTRTVLLGFIQRGCDLAMAASAMRKSLKNVRDTHAMWLRGLGVLDGLYRVMDYDRAKLAKRFGVTGLIRRRTDRYDAESQERRESIAAAKSVRPENETTSLLRLSSAVRSLRIPRSAAVRRQTRDLSTGDAQSDEPSPLNPRLIRPCGREKICWTRASS